MRPEKRITVKTTYGQCVAQDRGLTDFGHTEATDVEPLVSGNLTLVKL